MRRVTVRSLVLVIFALTLVSCQSLSSRSSSSTDRSEIDSHAIPLMFYYDGICASCETEESFRNLMQQELKGIDTDLYEYRVVDVNQSQDNWRQALAEDFPDQSVFTLPIVRMGDQLLVGESQIESNLRRAAHEALDLDYTAYTYYQRPDCPDCQEIDEVYQTWRYKEGIVVTEKNVQDEANLVELRALFDKHGIEGDNRQIPFFIEEDESEYWVIFRVNELLNMK